MTRRAFATLAVGAMLLAAGCSGSGIATSPASPSPVTSSAEVTAEPVTAEPEPSPSEAAAAVCSDSEAAGEVLVEIKDFVFDPAEIQAAVGQTVTFTNLDTAPHNAALDDRSCATPNLLKGRSAGLTFSAAGTYPFHCTVHPDMKGTITVS